MAKSKIAVAMSGGVDSSVVAALLVDQGYDVIGITMRVWTSHDLKHHAQENDCKPLNAVTDARHIAEELDIPHYVLDLTEPFKKTVVEYFVNAYSKGRTPNPCVVCNRFIKFGLLLDKARALGADYIATGHYIRNYFDDERQRYVLKRGLDDRKDQSYALYTLTQHQLKHTMFPLGTFSKDKVRELAKHYHLTTAQKAESQEICFIPEDDYPMFWESYTGLTGKKGPIKTLEGEVLGTHQGIHRYTIGQRRGLGIAYQHPLYVVKIYPKHNTVIVGENKDVSAKGLIANQLNWIAIPDLKTPLQVAAKVRYGAKPRQGTVYPLPQGKIKFIFDETERAITPGQSVVFYDNDLVIGGGTIEACLSAVN